jgi:hypothetical protein
VEKGEKCGKEISNYALWMFVFECLLSCSALYMQSLYKYLGIKFRQLFCYQTASEPCSYWYVRQMAVVTENILTIWSNLQLPAVCLALQPVLLPAVLCVCLVTLLVAASCLSLNSIHVESKRDSKMAVCKVHQWEDILRKEQTVGVTVKIVPWIIKVPSVSSNCNISAVFNLQRNKKNVLQNSVSGHLKYIIVRILVWYRMVVAEATETCWWVVIYDNTYFIDVRLLVCYKPII